ncbi:hypothetical protein, unlikely [Trypanosoma brucei gambiense DAL972]|uniref:Uncharacterized protein n=1 Tax=Trypanosoma brucei gambiense (strain MHOM/CI/86/DAL972) TaxID=679716 RepID=C9ZU75_TRYB9|nr:hypothetical protein, unlikely [Trypanosoma brucei gambiense DAL972]CBH12961.1 hypothetical protein, unlikely [Trypanosoma brucei gambiense DAL972]|eukprot:XP_011775240.1 hypothetical protein, unlikely [Trypanosoma brucei gambiense DAL972]
MIPLLLSFSPLLYLPLPRDKTQWLQQISPARYDIFLRCTSQSLRGQMRKWSEATARTRMSVRYFHHTTVSPEIFVITDETHKKDVKQQAVSNSAWQHFSPLLAHYAPFALTVDTSRIHHRVMTGCSGKRRVNMRRETMVSRSRKH